MSKPYVRIIAGRWRGLTLAFPDLPNVRPTPNRVRETLFNWLAPVIINARCLDLFAGSGALAIEALSRGAESVACYDQDAAVIHALRIQQQHLQADNLFIQQATFPYPVTQQFDIIFADPPFRSELAYHSSRWIVETDCLASDGRLYLETAQPIDRAKLGSDWVQLKQKKAGQVWYGLYQRALKTGVAQ